ncbi:MAG: MarR family transcriptional regulator [Eubacterium sp.]|jgi:DNA-binding MarR family transcriptional regulator|nr:MarR family transcriptional regulator [Eubacterium sp.]
MDTEQTLNRLLVQFFKYIMEIEERKLITDEFRDLTYNDMHIIEAIGMEKPRNMSAIAKLMSVTTGTLTRAVDALEKKGYVQRQRSSQDKRVVHIVLTQRGVLAFRHHEKFHQDMIAFILEHVSEEESVVLRRALEGLMGYFRQKYDPV